MKLLAFVLGIGLVFVGCKTPAGNDASGIKRGGAATELQCDLSGDPELKVRISDKRSDGYYIRIEVGTSGFISLPNEKIEGQNNTKKYRYWLEDEKIGSVEVAYSPYFKQVSVDYNRSNLSPGAEGLHPETFNKTSILCK